MALGTVIGSGAVVTLQPSGTPEILSVTTSAQQKTGLTSNKIYKVFALNGWVYIGQSNSTDDSNKEYIIAPQTYEFVEMGATETGFYYFGDASCSAYMVEMSLSTVKS